MGYAQHRVIAEPHEVSYCTRTRSYNDTEILEEISRRPTAAFLVRQVRLKDTKTVIGFERRRLSGQDLFGVFPLNLPSLTFETHSLWIDIGGGWKNTHLMRVSVAVLYDSSDDRFENYAERDMKRLSSAYSRWSWWWAST